MLVEKEEEKLLEFPKKKLFCINSQQSIFAWGWIKKKNLFKIFFFNFTGLW